MAVSVYIPTNSARTLLYSTPSSAFIVCKFLDDDHSDWCEVIYHYSFDFHFSYNEWYWASFHMFIGHLFVIFREMHV